VGSSDRKSAVHKRGDDGSAESSADAPSAAGAPESAGRETTLATPATRKVARELGVDIDDVPTDETRDGEAFVTGEIVRAYAEALESGASPAADAVDTSAPEPKSADASPSAPGSADETIPYRGVRRTIGKQMERSKYTAPHSATTIPPRSTGWWRRGKN